VEYTAQWMVPLLAHLPPPAPVLARKGEGIKQVSQNLYLLTAEKLSTNPVCCEISVPW